MPLKTTYFKNFKKKFGISFARLQNTSTLTAEFSMYLGTKFYLSCTLLVYIKR